jgi:hypothetical protein
MIGIQSNCKDKHDSGTHGYSTLVTNYNYKSGSYTLK